MKLFSYRHQGAIRSGVVIGDKGIDVAYLERAISGISAEQLSVPPPAPVRLIDLIGDPARLDALRRGVDRIEELPSTDLGTKIDLMTTEFAIPTPGTQKFLCVGRNYLDHVNESGHEVPGDPVVFARYEDSLVAHREDMICPSNSIELDWEGELAAIIGTSCRHIAEAEALGVVVGYSVFNDGSVRDYQHKTGQWTPGKNFSRSGSYGPYIVTTDEVADPQVLDIETKVNGEVVQHANTSQMIFSLAKVISFLSEWTELHPGDVIATGTPAGIGSARDPKWFLKAGDFITVTVSGVGELANQIADE